MKNMKNMKKFALLALATLSVALLLTAMTVSASASILPTEGECGDGVYWDYSAAGKSLTISGHGAMKDWSGKTTQPWLIYADNIEMLWIENGVTHIGDYAFVGLDQLETYTLGSVQSIGKYAFKDCVSLANGDMPLSVTSIGSGAFQGCTSLTAISIPVYLESIGTYAFYGCTSVTTITYSAVKELDFTAGNYIFADCGVAGAGIVVRIGPAVTHLPDNMFYSRTEYAHNIKTVIFESPNKLLTIGENAFRHCGDTLETVYYADYGYEKGSVMLPTSLTEIESGAFYGCTSLERITIPEKVNQIGTYAFHDCTGLTELTYKPTAKLDFTAGNYVFSNLGTASTGVTLYIGENVTHIPENFMYSTTQYPINVKEICFLGNKVQTISDQAFRHCAGTLISVYPAGVDRPGALVLPEGVTTVGANAFYGASKITALVIPSTVTKIGTYAFYDCTGLTELTYKPTAKLDFTAGNYVFSNLGTASTGVTLYIGENVTHIPENFMYSTTQYPINVKEICFLGNKVQTISDQAFRHCAGTLISVYPAGVDRPGALVLPEGVTTVGANAFYGASKITALVIPSTVTKIGTSAFRDMVKVVAFEYHARSVANFTSGNYVFSELGAQGSGVILYVGKDVTSIPENMFYSSSKYVYKVTTVYLYNPNIATIGKNAFNHTDSYLRNVIFCGTASEWSAVSVKGGNDTFQAKINYHTHDWRHLDFIKEPTCEEGGVERLVCSCYLTKEASVEKLGHSVGKWTIVEDPTCVYVGKEEGACVRCGKTQTRTVSALGHAFNHGCDPTCNRCDFVRTSLTHAWQSSLSYDKDTHWIACDNCDERLDEAEHDCNKVVGEPTANGHVLACACGQTTDVIGHTERENSHLCLICAYKITNCIDDDRDHFCDICPVRTSDCEDKDDDHLCDLCSAQISDCGDNDRDHNCDLCTQKLSDCTDADNDHLCDVCKAALSTCADADNDHNCDLCTATLSACTDANNDHNCDLCGTALSTCPTDTDGDHRCDVCGVEMTHNFYWNSSADAHWQDCPCGISREESAHEFGEGVITRQPTVEEEGVKRFECPTCGYSYEESIARLDPPADGDTDDSQKPEEPKSGCGASLTAGTTLVLLCLGAALTLCKKKKD